MVSNKTSNQATNLIWFKSLAKENWNERVSEEDPDFVLKRSFERKRAEQTRNLFVALNLSLNLIN